jgi:hypothetical protein
MLWAAAGAILAAALILSAFSYHALRDHAASSAKFCADIGRLRALQARADRCDGALKAFEAVSGSVTSSPLAIMRERLPDCRADMLKEDRAEQIPGWILKRQSLALVDVALARVLPVIAEIEGRQRPSWRLAQFAVEGSPRGAGFGRVELLWESLERAVEAPPPAR